MAAPMNAAQQRVHKKMERASQDLIKVYNPTKEPIEVTWDSDLIFRIPAKTDDIGHGIGFAVHPRYIALRYVEKMDTQLVTEEAGGEVEKENKLRAKSGMKKMDAQEQVVVENKVYLDQAKKEARIKLLWHGLVRKYAEEKPEQESGIRRQDTRSVIEQMISQLEESGAGVQTSTNAEDLLPSQQMREEQ